MPVKINGASSGSVTLAAPASGSDVTVTLPGSAGTVATTADVTATGATVGLVPITPSSIANSGGSASFSGAAVTFSSVTSVSLNGVFSATYDNYVVYLRATPGTTNYLLCRFRASGADTSSGYANTLIYNTGGNTPQGATQGATQFQVLGNGSSDGASKFEVFSPRLPNVTLVTGQAYSHSGDMITFTASQGGTTQFDGLSFYTNTGSVSGTIRVYGLRNA